MDSPPRVRSGVLDPPRPARLGYGSSATPTDGARRGRPHPDRVGLDVVLVGRDKERTGAAARQLHARCSRRARSRIHEVRSETIVLRDSLSFLRHAARDLVRYAGALRPANSHRAQVPVFADHPPWRSRRTTLTSPRCAAAAVPVIFLRDSSAHQIDSAMKATITLASFAEKGPSWLAGWGLSHAHRSSDAHAAPAFLIAPGPA